MEQLELSKLRSKQNILIDWNVLHLFNLTINEYIILKIISNQKYGCYLQNYVLEYITGLSIRTIQRIIYKLRDKGFILIKENYNNHRKLMITNTYKDLKI